MRKIFTAISTVALALAMAVTTAAPAQAATSRIVMVQVSGVPSSWPVTSALDWVDQYTGSDMRYGACVTGRKCIVIRYATIRSAWAAVTYGALSYYSSGNRVTIYLNPQRNGYSWTAKRRIIIHELGHANGLTYHSAYCSNIMWPGVKCNNGTYPPLRFTDWAKARLRAN